MQHCCTVYIRTEKKKKNEITNEYKSDQGDKSEKVVRER